MAVRAAFVRIAFELVRLAWVWTVHHLMAMFVLVLKALLVLMHVVQRFVFVAIPEMKQTKQEKKINGFSTKKKKKYLICLQFSLCSIVRSMIYFD